MLRGQDDGSWSRAYMAGSGLSLSPRAAKESPVRHIAEGADLSRERMLELAHHRDPGVREALARREDCPFGVLAALAHDSKVAVRGAVASHVRAGVTVLDHLAGDRDAFVVKAVVRNPAASDALLDRLSSHRREEVRHLVDKVRAERLDTGAAEHVDASPWLTRTSSTRLHEAGPAQADRADAGETVRRRNPTVLPPRPVAGARSRPVPEAGPGTPIHFVPGT